VHTVGWVGTSMSIVGLHNGFRNLGCTLAGTVVAHKQSCISGMNHGHMIQGKLLHKSVGHMPMHSPLPHHISSRTEVVRRQVHKPDHIQRTHSSNGILDGNQKKLCRHQQVHLQAQVTWLP